jgi:hypothetical protein
MADTDENLPGALRQHDRDAGSHKIAVPDGPCARSEHRQHAHRAPPYGGWPEPASQMAMPPITGATRWWVPHDSERALTRIVRSSSLTSGSSGTSSDLTQSNTFVLGGSSPKVRVTVAAGGAVIILHPLVDHHAVSVDGVLQSPQQFSDHRGGEQTRLFFQLSKRRLLGRLVPFDVSLRQLVASRPGLDDKNRKAPSAAIRREPNLAPWTPVGSIRFRGEGVAEKKLFGCFCFLLHGNVCVGVWKQGLLVRLDSDGYEDALKEPCVREFDITGRPLKG